MGSGSQRMVCEPPGVLEAFQEVCKVKTIFIKMLRCLWWPASKSLQQPSHPRIHSLVWSPSTFFQGWSAGLTDYDRRDGMSLLSLGHKSHVTSVSCPWGDTDYSWEPLNARYLVVLDKCANSSKNERYWKEQCAGSQRPGLKTCCLWNVLGREASEMLRKLSESELPQLGGGDDWTKVELP